MYMPKAYVEELLEPKIFERIMKAIGFEEPDRVPIWDHIDNWRVREYFAPGENDSLDAHVKVYHGLVLICAGGSALAITRRKMGGVLLEGV